MRRVAAALAILVGLAGGSGCAAGRAAPERRPDAAPPSAYGQEPDVPLTPLEASAVQALVGARRGSATPATSGTLVLAARELARRAADGEKDPIAPRRVRAALGRCAGLDPAPGAALVTGAPAELPAALAGHAQRGATHLGVGAEVRGARAWVVAISSVRTAHVDPFPRRVTPGERHRLRGALAGLDAARVVVTLPAGTTRELAASAGATFEATVGFDDPGRYVIEILGTSARGPQVAAILAVDAGDAAGDERPPVAALAAEEEPEELAAAEARVLAALNALRRSQGLAPVAPSAAVARVARRHSADMAARDELAHVLPGSGDLATRLRRAGIGYRRAVENVAKAGAALEAHELAEQSPAHRANMLNPAVTAAGIGIARIARRGGAPLVYLTEILVDPVAERSPARAEAEVREELGRARARHGLPPLAADAALGALARGEAEEMARGGSLRQPRLGDRVELEGRRLAAADAHLTSNVGDAAGSRHAADARFQRVGVGVAAGRKDGAQPLWIVVVFSD